MKRFAFTLLELVFVIIVMGILAVLAMPNFTTQPLQQAAEQIAGHIRYTQHLAMVSDDFNESDATWWLRRWQIRFYASGTPLNYYYTIFYDKDKNRNVNHAVGDVEVAIDPLTNKKLHESDDNGIMDLTGTHGISKVVSSCSTNDGSLLSSNLGVFAFDKLGRPYNGISNAASQSQYLLTQNCTIKLEHTSDGNATITVFPETGYVDINYTNP
ncbi:prepilin-type N-terminal cleavage/methylation domain-containing protein [Sulfuricurvum sp.]|uniref:pilus assembly FimT family protein n=1 Tax=Sulfuricurvum sp. TaxID=2025608 RepID=UPI002E30E2AA|nr:prepilin-type N-terminal cleavage/methylation domain-containing protein [Sulfuricurvum sp.]HEX5330868.1 prepilin-type N-terminal cleavage/methylation domain-containing protein [Sulfuricurvum sp.]